jgi:PBSX family phage terminase large subunit
LTSVAIPEGAFRFKPYGGCAEVFRCTDTEVLLCGPAGTGKSRACLERVFQLMTEYPGSRWFMVRKTRASLTQSAMVTFEQEVVIPHSVKYRVQEQEYRHVNGSTCFTTGMGEAAERDKVKSSQFDGGYVQEATEIIIDDWELLLSRLRNGVVPWHQIIADCNPVGPSHWLKRRCDEGRCKLINTVHQDNPALWDGFGWTTLGKQYMATLDALTGVRRARLLDGRWAAAEGLVYDDWDPNVHVIDRFPIPAEWERIRVYDFGYTNPFVCQWWALDADRRAYLYRELYCVETLVEDAARQVAALSKDETFSADVCDHDAEGRATLERHVPCRTLAASKSVIPGIQAVQTRLRKAGDGRPRLFMFRDAPTRRDARLSAKHLPCSSLEEIDGYVWDTREGKPPKEEPVKAGDHGMDCMRYAVAFFDGLGVREARVI